MASPRRPGGYVDRCALARAVVMNERITRRMRAILAEGRAISYERVLELVTHVGLDLAEQRSELARMERIRKGTDDGMAGEQAQ